MTPPRDVVGELRRFFHQEKIPHAAGVLVAVSGGRDSMVLGEGMARLGGMRWAVASVNHGLRAEAAAETAMVMAAAERWGVAGEVISLVPPAEKPQGLLAWARDARYAALEGVRQKAGFAFIATAHHAQDQAETVLVRLARGGIVRGMRARRGAVLRPLLGLFPEDLDRFAEKHALAWAEDASNHDRQHLRARIRDEALPALKAAMQRDPVEALSHWAEQMAEDDSFLSQCAETALADATATGSASPSKIALSLLQIAPRPVARRILLLWWNQLRWQQSVKTPPAQRQLDDLLDGHGVQLSGGRIENADQHLVFVPDARPKPDGDTVS